MGPTNSVYKKRLPVVYGETSERIIGGFAETQSRGPWNIGMTGSVSDWATPY